jgi:cobalt/nickel transport protein
MRSHRALLHVFAMFFFVGHPESVVAHFQELIPSVDIVTPATGGTIELDLTFTHPFDRGPVMDMAPPVQFGVLSADGRKDLRDRLVRRDADGKRTWKATHTLAAPGSYVFFVEPAPYWEPAEGVMIVHYTKVVVEAFGAGDDWDAMVGLPVEIEPLVRPYGLWTGNAFRGVVRRDGEPLPFAEVEVEWRNDGSVTAPADAFVTQVVKADATGAFTYVMPRAGWWGFAALVEGAQPMKGPEGKDVPVELGALMWVRVVDMK